MGKSFNDIVETIKKRKIEINDLITYKGLSLDEAKLQVGSLWNNLFPSKKNLQSQLIDIDSLFPQFNTETAKNELENLQRIQKEIDLTKGSWDDYNNQFKDGQKYLLDYAKQNNVLKSSVDDVKQANQQARASAIAHNEAIKAQTFSAKAGKVALQALAMAGNMLAGLLIAKAFQVAVTAINNYIHKVEKANEAMNEAVGEYESAKSSLESINSELEEQNKQIDDLLVKDKLTYVEKGQLEELQAITKELLLQQDIEERRADKTSKEAADKAVDAYNKQYGRYDSSREDLDKKLSYENFYLPEDEDDVHGNIAAYVKATESLAEAQKKYQTALKNGEDTTWLADDVQYSIDSVNDLSQVLDDNLTDLQEKRLALEEEYNKAIEKRKKDIEPLTSSEQDIITTYKSIYDTMKMVYEYTNQNDWNDMEIENIFNTEGIEKTKEELAEMAKSGELTPETIASYKNLNAAIQDSEIFLKNGQTAAEAFCEQINALNDAINYDDVRKQLMQSLGFGDTIDSASEAQLWNEISSLGEEELVLEAYLKVKDQYGEHPEGWNAKDWISHIQSELEAKELEVNISFEDAWADSYTSESDAVKELANNLLELAEQGRLTKETFEEADSTAGDYFKNLGVSADEAVSKINKLVDESKQLSSMASQLSSISDTLGTKRDDGFVSADTLSGFDVEVRGLESWDRFQEVLGSTASSYEECQEAANALATEWVNSSNFLAQLTEENKEYYETQLQAMGVENYEEVIEYVQELNSAKEALAQASFDVATATNEEIQSLIDEGAYSELAQQQIWNLALAKQTEEGITLDSSADCQNLLALAQNAGVTGTAIELLTQLLEIYNNLAAGTYGTNAQVINAVKNKAESLKNQINDLLVNGANSDTVELDPRIKVSPSAKSAAKSAGKETGKSYEEGLKEELSDLENVISGITSRIDDNISSINSQKSAALESIDAQKEALEEAKEAAIEVLEAEKNAQLAIIEEQKKTLEKQIKAKQDEIDKINEAADARERELNLQRAQFELEKMQNQKTKLVNYMPDTIVI